MALQKPDGCIRLFTSTYDNFIQTAGIRDGASHCAKILSCFYANLDTTDTSDPDVIIKVDIANAFNTTNRALTLDVIGGRASRDYACGLKLIFKIGSKNRPPHHHLIVIGTQSNR